MFKFLIVIIIIAVIVIMIRKKLIKDLPKKTKSYISLDDQFNSERRDREIEIDQLLSKIGKNGLEDLNKKDRERLDELSKKIK